MLFFLIVASTCLSSCSNFYLEDPFGLKDVDPEIATMNHSTQSYRLRINNDFTSIVHVTYVNQIVVDVQYEIDDQITSDIYAVLDLRCDSASICNYSVLITNPNVNSLTYAGDTYESRSPGGPLTYDCECTAFSKPNDCLPFNYVNLYYCDGIECLACSVVIDFLEADEPLRLTNNSAILLPNFN